MKVILLLCCIVNIYCQEIDYFWRNYHGKIFKDAYPAGEDVNGKETYIGQAYIHDHGLLIGQIFPPTQNIKVATFNGVKKTDRALKVLCTNHRSNFEWLRTTSLSFPADSHGKHLIVGGTEFIDFRAELYIGRAMYQGVLQIGQISSNDKILKLIHLNRVIEASSFDVLIYNNSTINLPVY